MIANLDRKIQSNFTILHSKELESQLEYGNGKILPKRTTFELENLLFMRFDIRKKN